MGMINLGMMWDDRLGKAKARACRRWVAAVMAAGALGLPVLSSAGDPCESAVDDLVARAGLSRVACDGTGVAPTGEITCFRIAGTGPGTPSARLDAAMSSLPGPHLAWLGQWKQAGEGTVSRAIACRDEAAATLVWRLTVPGE